MKRLLFIILMLGCMVSAYTQNKIKYTYDESGNRIKKEIVLSSTRSLLSEDDEQEAYTEEIQSHQITIYPNPTKGLLNVKIAGLDKINGQISIYNMGGKLCIRLLTLVTSPMVFILCKSNLKIKFPVGKL